MAPRRSVRIVDVLRKQTKTTAEDDQVLVEESSVRSVGTVTVEERRTATPPKIVKVVPVTDSKKKKAREEKANENAVEQITTQEAAAAATPTAAPAAKEQKDAKISREATEAAAPKEAEQKGTKKIEKETEGKGIRKRKRRRASRGGGGGYRRYVFRVLKQVHPEMGVSSKAMAVLNGFMDDMFERIVSEAAQLFKYSRRMTLSAKEIQGAVRLVLPGDLGNHAVAEGTKAVTSYYSTVNAGY